ncbi:ATP-binding protein [Streptomyces sp. NPDC050121]|uniref:ATP-binding protein n=1 Tax=Streptomyces sp. NPDC050121 TaxID=3365601 RepID=UPI00379477B7
MGHQPGRSVSLVTHARRRPHAGSARRSDAPTGQPAPPQRSHTELPLGGEWGQVVGDEVLATAILDRLLHLCEVIAINGPSYRLKNRLQAIERETDVA